MQSAIRFLSRWSPWLANKAFLATVKAYRSQKYAAVLPSFKVLAEQNHTEAQVLLARMYRNGEGTPVDYEEAAKWTRLAAANGHAEAQYIMGLIYDDGNLVSEDHSQALRWYRLSAQQGFPHAQIKVANCFHEGSGVDRDESMAAWWVSQGADQGDAGAQFHLGSRFLYAFGVERNNFDAFFWLDLAAKVGNEEAIAARTQIAQQIEPSELAEIERGCAALAWKPKPSADSAFDIFAFAARQTVQRLKTILGAERFDALATTERKWPSVGEVILENTHGYKLSSIASNLQKHLVELDESLDVKISAAAKANDPESLPTARTILQFIRRIDDLADVGTVVGERTADLTHNLMEYHLSLVKELEGCVDSEFMETLLQRFSVKQGLRASRLAQYADLYNVLLPIDPW